MAIFGEDGVLYWVAAYVSADGSREPVLVRRRLSPQELNLLFVLSEHVNRCIPIDDICFRLTTTENAVRVAATKLRRKLHYDWTVESQSNKGMRLLFVGHRLSAANRTHIDIRPVAVRSSNQNFKYLEEQRRRRWANRISKVS